MRGFLMKNIIFDDSALYKIYLKPSISKKYENNKLHCSIISLTDCFYEFHEIFGYEIDELFHFIKALEKQNIAFLPIAGYDFTEKFFKLKVLLNKKNKKKEKNEKQIIVSDNLLWAFATSQIYNCKFITSKDRESICNIFKIDFETL